MENFDIVTVDQNAANVAALSTDENEFCLEPIGDYLLVNNVLRQQLPNKSRLQTKKIQLPFDVPDSFTTEGNTCDGTGNQNQTYNLLGVLQHLGVDKAGHYIAFVKRGDRWWKCDDKDVTKSSFDDVRAAMLFVYPPKMLLYGKEDATTVSGKPKGIQNIGNSCYTNAALQLLFSVPDLLVETPVVQTQLV